jgi:crotonobetaine/carnitine-CoA ligase
VRADDPWTDLPRVLRRSAATAKAWRNGWFHTGDAFRRDAAGNYFSRRPPEGLHPPPRRETSRRFEVESAVVLYPAVREAAAVAVPSADSEDEVLVAIGLKAATRSSRRR